ncbi:MAG: cytochrome c1 [Alphaproteobacteria bacterium]|nr:cytochrome c1 [Alphaproteobacteria bacterium]
MRKILSLAAAAALFGLAGPALAAGDAQAPKTMYWPHGGFFGTYDKAAVQRGYQVYKEVCAGCHSLKYIAFRNLTEIGLSEGEVKAIAASYQIQDGPNDQGEMFERPGRPSDRLPSPFPNEKAARAANNGAAPPDLSLIVKARGGYENYLYSLLTGYGNPPAGVALGDGMNYNPYFPGRQIAMASPLNADAVSFADGTKATVEQMASDITQFLAWAAEPTQDARKRMGVKVVLFLILLSFLLYAAKKRVWSDVH